MKLLTVALLALVAMAAPAYADTYHATGHTDAAYCSANFGIDFCSQETDDISFALDFTTGANTGPLNAVGDSYLPILSMTGKINDASISCTGLCGSFLATHGDYAGPPLPQITTDGWGLLDGPDEDPFDLSANPHIRVFATDANGRGLGDMQALTTWNIVQTPEPSALLLLAMGMGLLALVAYKRQVIPCGQ